jgi:hypothetical protein
LLAEDPYWNTEFLRDVREVRFMPESRHVRRNLGCHGILPQGPTFVVWHAGFLLSVDP